MAICLAANSLLRDVLANPRSRLKHLGKTVEIGDSRFFGVLRRLWIPLVILAVIGGGGWTVSRLHGVFGAEKRPLYADTGSTDSTVLQP